MDDFDLARQLEKSLLDAVNNDQHELAEKLRDTLCDVNERIVLGDFSIVVVEV